MKAIAEKSEKILTNAIIIGGALALTYFLVTSLSGSSKSKKKKAKAATPVVPDSAEEESAAQHEEPSVIAQVGNVLMAQATGLLLSIAREKLVEFLQSQAAKKGKTHEHS